MAPVLAITSVVARTLWLRFFDPVGEFVKPFVTGPKESLFPARSTGMSTDKKLWRNRKAKKEQRDGCSRRTPVWRWFIHTPRESTWAMVRITWPYDRTGTRSWYADSSVSLPICIV
jgi:hypothetical protein